MRNTKLQDVELATQSRERQSVSTKSLPVHSGYRHILILTSLDAGERSALTLGLEMAQAHQARLTLLRVLEPEKESNPIHWLDAIENLHSPRPISAEAAPSPKEDAEAEVARMQSLAYLEQTVPARLRDEVNIHAECRVGDVAHEVIRFANQMAVDLLILPLKRLVWWSPMFPSPSRQIIRVARARVILVSADSVEYPARSVE